MEGVGQFQVHLLLDLLILKLYNLSKFLLFYLILLHAYLFYRVLLFLILKAVGVSELVCAIMWVPPSTTVLAISARKTINSIHFNI